MPLCTIANFPAAWGWAFTHYMLKEIRESPYAIANTCAVFHTAERELEKICTGADRVIITGCGTAYNSGLVAKRYVARPESTFASR